MFSRKRVNKRVPNSKLAVTEKRAPRQNRFLNNSLVKDKNRKILSKWLFQIILSVTAIFIVSIGMIFIHDLFTQADFFDIQAIDVTGTEHLAKEDIIEQAEISVGDNLLGINLKQIRQRLLAHPWIEDVQVTRTIPDRLCVDVTEYKPEAVINIKDEHYIISNKGILFKSLTEDDPPTLPIVTGISYADIPVADLAASEPFKAVLKVFEMGQASAALIPTGQLKAIRMDSELGLTLEAFDPVISIRIGYDHYPQKYQNLKRALNYLRDENLQFQVRTIDLVDLDQIVVTPVYSEDPRQG